MTDRAKKLRDVKNLIRSLLLSSPLDLPVRQLLQDYHSFVGESLDYRSMGYPTAEDFFRDIDDTVEIGWRQGGMVLRAVANEQTEHIQKLVSKQKVSTKLKTKIYRQRGPPRRQEDSRPQRYSKGGLLPSPLVVPAYVRNQIIQLFRSYPEGILFKHFDDAFVRQFGCRLNFTNYGFKSWDMFLDSLKDVISMKQNADGSFWLLPVVLDSSYYRHQKQRESNPVQSGHTVQHINQESTKVRPSKGRGRRRQSSGNSDTSVGNYARSEASTGSNDSTKSRERKDRLELEIQQVLEDRPDGVWASKFPEEFQAKYGRPLDYTHHGYLSVIEFIANASNVVHIERPTPQGDWKLYDARIPRPQEDTTEDICQSKTTTIQKLETETKEAIYSLLKSQPYGIPTKEFPAFYKEKTGLDIPVKELGYKTPDDYFLSLADSVLQMNYIRGNLMMYSVDADIPIESVPTPVERTTQTGCPIDAVGPGCHYTPVMCPNTNEYTGLFVSNIINPRLFWVILRQKQNSLALELLMNQIDEFYNSLDAKEYVIPEKMVCTGQVCAILFPEDNNWHRGVITKVNDEGFAGIYYVDYGNTAYIPKKAVKFLKSDFLKLPAQAIQARLANIVPSTGKWKVKSRNRMLELVKEKPLIGYITDVKSQVLSVCLTDTSDPNIDLHINDVLVTEGHAQFSPDDQVPEHVSKNQHKDVPDYCHVFGWNIKEAPRLPQAAGVELQQDVNNGNVQTDKIEYCYVKWLQLTKDRVIHLINLDRVAYVVSAELSSFFWEEDILGSMLKRKNVDAKKRTVSSDEYPKLFEDLMKYNVKSFRAEMLSKRQFISLYELNSVPAILQTFLTEEAELIEAVEDLITKFDPDSPYWKTGESKPTESKDGQTVQEQSPIDTVDETLEMEETMNLSVDEKQMVLQALQFKRKRILQTLMSSSSCSTDLVNELNNCETEIMMLKQQIAEHSQSETTKSSVNKDSVKTSPDIPNQTGTGTQVNAKTPVVASQLSSTDSQPPTLNTNAGTQQSSETDRSAENRRVIQNIINSTTKPIATANIVTKAITSMSVSETGSCVSNSIPYNFQNQYATQSQTGSYPGMMGLRGSLQQGLPNQMWMLQQGMMPNPRLANLQNFNAMMGTNGNMAPAMVPGFPQGFPGHMNPMFNAQIPFPSIANGNLPNPQGNMNQMGMGSVPSMGRGQPMGILPGLLPLFQNLTVARGRGGQ